MLVQDILDRKGGQVYGVGPDSPVGKAVGMLATWNVGVVLVTNPKGNLLGIISERDLVRGIALHGALALQCDVEKLMTPDVTTCKPGDRIDEAMTVMTAHRIRHLPVMDDGRLVGLVSIGDLVKAKLLEKEQEANVLRDITLART